MKQGSSEASAISPERDWKPAVVPDLSRASLLGVGTGVSPESFSQDEVLEAERALEWGLLNEIADDPVAAAKSAAAVLGALPPRDHAIRRQLLKEATSNSYEDALAAHLAACAREQRWLRGDADDSPEAPVAVAEP
jgi:enoyl-CoA hydratase/carnithine racemase